MLVAHGLLLRDVRQLRGADCVARAHGVRAAPGVVAVVKARGRRLWAIEERPPWEWPSIDEADTALEQLARLDTVPRPAPAATRRSIEPKYRNPPSPALEWAIKSARALDERERTRCKHFYVETGPGQARCRWCQHGVSFSARHPVRFADPSGELEQAADAHESTCTNIV